MVFARRLMALVLLLTLTTIASAGLFEDPISAVLSGGTATGESEIQVPVGSEFKLVYSENRAFLGGEIVKWTIVVVPSEGIDISKTEDFFSGKITRFMGREPGIFVIGLTALEEIDGTTNSYTRKYTVNVTAPTSENVEECDSYDDSTTSENEKWEETNTPKDIETKIEASHTPDISSTAPENTTQETTNIDHVVNSTNGSIETQETHDSDSNGDGVKFIILMLVVIPLLYILRKKGMV